MNNEIYGKAPHLVSVLENLSSGFSLIHAVSEESC